MYTVIPDKQWSKRNYKTKFKGFCRAACNTSDFFIFKYFSDLIKCFLLNMYLIVNCTVMCIILYYYKVLFIIS